MNVAGGDEVSKMLDNLSKAEQGEFKKAAKKEIRQAAKPILNAAKAGAPDKTGRLKRAIKLRAWRRPNRGEIGVKVFIDPGKSRDDPKGAYYGAMRNSGFIANGTYVPGSHFMENAHDRHGEAAASNLAAGLSSAADKVIRAS